MPQHSQATHMGVILELERELAGVLSLSDLAGPILDRFQRLVGATGCTIFSFDAAGAVGVQGGSIAHVLREYEPHRHGDDVAWSWNYRRPGHELIHFGDAGAVATVRKTQAYQDFYRPRDIGFICGVWPTGLRFGAAHMFGLLLTTPVLDRPFHQKDYEKLRRLEMPLRSAAQRIARFRAIQSRASVLEQLLERQAAAIALWDSQGRLVVLSAEAQQALAGGIGRTDLEGAARLAFRQLQRGAGPPRDAMLGRPRVLRSRRGALLRVEFSWLGTPEGSPWLLAELHPLSGARAQLATLTGAETRVLQLLARGLSTRELSEILQVSRETIKTHVKHIMAKLGVSSRLKAAALARDAWNVS